jgi:hypothetical protein
MKSFIKVGNQIISIYAIALVDLAEESVAITLMTPAETRLEFTGDEAKKLQNYFIKNSDDLLKPIAFGSLPQR